MLGGEGRGVSLDLVGLADGWLWESVTQVSGRASRRMRFAETGTAVTWRGACGWEWVRSLSRRVVDV